MRKWTPEEKARIMERVANAKKDGISYTQIAKEEGVATSLMSYWRGIKKVNGKKTPNPVKIKVTKLATLEPTRKYVKKSEPQKRMALFVGTPAELREVLNGLS